MRARKTSKKAQSGFRPAFLRRGLLWACALLVCVSAARAQQPNPVDRQVTNPLTDAPNVNPLLQNQPVPTRRPSRNPPNIKSGDELNIEANSESVTGEAGQRVIVYAGNVDARITVYQLQADKITYYEKT